MVEMSDGAATEVCRSRSSASGWLPLMLQRILASATFVAAGFWVGQFVMRSELQVQQLAYTQLQQEIRGLTGDVQRLEASLRQRTGSRTTTSQTEMADAGNPGHNSLSRADEWGQWLRDLQQNLQRLHAELLALSESEPEQSLAGLKFRIEQYEQVQDDLLRRWKDSTGLTPDSIAEREATESAEEALVSGFDAQPVIVPVQQELVLPIPAAVEMSAVATTVLESTPIAESRPHRSTSGSSEPTPAFDFSPISLNESCQPMPGALDLQPIPEVAVISQSISPGGRPQSLSTPRPPRRLSFTSFASGRPAPDLITNQQEAPEDDADLVAPKPFKGSGSAVEVARPFPETFGPPSE